MTLRSSALRLLALLVTLVVVAAACSSSGGGSDASNENENGSGNGDGNGGQQTASGADCLVGEWTMDYASYFESFSGFLGRVGGPTLSETTAVAIDLTMDGDRFLADFAEFFVVLTLPAGAGETTVTATGEQSGDYTATDDTLTVTNLESTLEAMGTFTVGGEEIAPPPGVDLTEFAQVNLFADPMQYTCEGDRLELRTVVPDLDEEVAVSWDRAA